MNQMDAFLSGWTDAPSPFTSRHRNPKGQKTNKIGLKGPLKRDQVGVETPYSSRQGQIDYINAKHVGYDPVDYLKITFYISQVQV